MQPQGSRISFNLNNTSNSNQSILLPIFFLFLYVSVHKNLALVRKSICWHCHKVFYESGPLAVCFFKDALSCNLSDKYDYSEKNFSLTNFFRRGMFLMNGEGWGCNSVAHSIKLYHSICIPCLVESWAGSSCGRVGDT